MKNVLPAEVQKKLPVMMVPARIKAARFAGDDYGVTDSPDWRGIDWAQHLHRIEIFGTEVNYVDIGEAGGNRPEGDRPIVFVHGLGGQWQNWLENVPRFSQSRRVVAVDLPGFGLSDMPDEKITIEFYGRVLAELCERLDLIPAVLVGNSMGGYVAAELAIQQPEHVERLMLLAAAGVSQMDVAKRPIIAAAKAAGLVITTNAAHQEWIAHRPGLRHAVLAVVARHPSRLAADMCFEGLLKGAAKAGFETALRACLEYDLRERLPQIGCPVLVVWGEKDAIIPVRDADKFVELIDGARKVVMEDTGHVPMVERPPTFNDLLEEFLSHEVVEDELEGRLDHARSSPTGDYKRSKEHETA